MNRVRSVFPVIFSFFFLFSQAHAQHSDAKTASWPEVETAIGRAGQAQADGAYKFGFPRGDMKVTVEGVQVKPTLALGSWVAFSSPGNDAMMMGDLVLSEDEVTPVMTSLEESGIEVTALHNHVLHESPRVMYMHVGAHGDAVKLAAGMKRTLELTKTPAPSAPPAQQANLDFDTAGIEQALGRKGKVNGGVLQFGVPRTESITHDGMKVPGSMGLSTGINFQPTGSGKAAITGDFVLVDSEVNPVIKALRASGIQVTAVHNHMILEKPRLFFMHFWANDDAVKLAKGLRAALDQTNSAK
jgi:biotin operon repressor